MIQVGQYDAFDKWNLLCRFWQNPSLVLELGLNKFERPRLENWQQAALQSGSRACFEYIRARVDGITRGRNRGGWPPAPETSVDAISDDISRLLEAIGYTDLYTKVFAFAEVMGKSGPDAAYDSDFSPVLAERIKDVFKSGALSGLLWTNEPAEIPNIEILREQTSQTFPKEAIRNKKIVLSLFSAYFYGRSDVIHIHDADPKHVTLVDVDAAALEDMKLIYPQNWTYVHQDYAAFLADAAKKGATYDLIVSDPFRGYGEAVGWQHLPAIMRMCTDVFVTNYFIEMFEELGVGPDDLTGLSRAVSARTGVDVQVTETVQRSTDVHWVVMRRGKSYTEAPRGWVRSRF